MKECERKDVHDILNDHPSKHPNMTSLKCHSCLKTWNFVPYNLFLRLTRFVDFKDFRTIDFGVQQ